MNQKSPHGPPSDSPCRPAITAYSRWWIFAVALCLLATGCSYRQAYIDGQEDHQLSNDHAGVDSAEQEVRSSLNESGPDSERTMNARTDFDDAQRKVIRDQRQYDNYLSASGQSSVPRE